MHIAYAAHTRSCTFLLDAHGVCRWVLALPGARQAALDTAHRCVGAQYVASLDPLAEGMLVQRPAHGATMLFARLRNGRISLLRTEPLMRLEIHEDEETPQVAEEHAAASEWDEEDTKTRTGTDDAPTVRRVRPPVRHPSPVIREVGRSETKARPPRRR